MDSSCATVDQPFFFLRVCVCCGGNYLIMGVGEIVKGGKGIWARRSLKLEKWTRERGRERKKNVKAECGNGGEGEKERESEGEGRMG